MTEKTYKYVQFKFFFLSKSRRMFQKKRVLALKLIILTHSMCFCVNLVLDSLSVLFSRLKRIPMVQEVLKKKNQENEMKARLKKYEKITQ